MSSFSSGRQFGLALRRDLADEDVARLHVRADADDATLVEIEQRLFRDVRNLARDLFLTALRVADVQLQLLNVDRRIHVVLHEALGQNDGVLEVVAVPRHERHGDVRAERKLTHLGAGAVREDVTLLDALAMPDERPLVDRRVLVGAPVLLQAIAIVLGEPRERTIVTAALFRCPRSAGPASTMISSAVTRDTTPARFAMTTAPESRGDLLLETRSDERRAGIEKRHRLPLHVRAHQRAVRVVVLEEWNQRCRDGHELLGRDVHVVHTVARHERYVALLTAEHEVLGECPVLLELRVGLGDDRVFLAIGVEPHDLVANTLPFFTTRYGVSTNPRSFTRAKHASDVISPMFGPSGVSIGHMRPYCE